MYIYKPQSVVDALLTGTWAYEISKVPCRKLRKENRLVIAVLGNCAMTVFEFFPRLAWARSVATNFPPGSGIIDVVGARVRSKPTRRLR